MAKRIGAAFLTLLFFSFLAFPMEAAYAWTNPTVGESSSAYGYRVHPIYGTVKHHSGEDIAAAEGTPVVAAAAGRVIQAWDRGDGYGICIVIDHGNGYFTRYGHLRSAYVSADGQVLEGQTIGEVGTTGNSTGPHLHFEVRVGSEWGETLNPADVVPGLGSAENGAVAMDGMHSVHDWEVVNDFAKFVKDVVDKFVELMTTGLKTLQNTVAEIFFVLCCIDIALGAMQIVMTPASEEKETLAHWIVRRGLFYGFCLVFLYNWGDFIGNLSLYGFPQLGGLMGGDVKNAAAAVSDPTNIIQKGMHIIAPIVNAALRDTSGSFFSFLFGSPSTILVLIGAFVLFVCFCIIGIYIALAYLEFYAAVLFSFGAFPMAGVSKLRHFASNGINGVIAASINLMFICFFAAQLQASMADFVADGIVTKAQVVSSTPGSRAGAETNATVAGPEVYIQMAREAARRYGVPEDLFCAQIQAESGWNPNADNGVARGIAQFTDETAAGFGIDPFDPAQALDAAAKYDRGLYDKFGSWDLAFAAYNAGPGNVEKYGGVPPFEETENYLAKIYGTTEFGGNIASGAIRGAVRFTFNLGMMVILIVITLKYMYFCDRITRLINTQFGNAGFRLSDKQGVFN